MTNRTLEIILKLRDELTAKMKGAEGAMRQFSAYVKEFGIELKKFGREISQIGSALTTLGAVMTGPLALAFNQSSKYSISVTDEITRLKTVTDMFNLSIGEALVPVMHNLNNILGRLYQAWENLGATKQRAIIQTVFITGVFLTFGGIILRIAGTIVKLSGEIILLIRNMSPLQLSVLAVVSAIILMIEYWGKIRQVAVPVLNAIEIAASMLAIGFHKVISGMVDGLITLSINTADFFRLLAQVPGPQQELFLKAAEGLDKLASKMRFASVAERKTVEDLQTNIEKIFVTGSGKLGDMADEAAKRWGDVKKAFNGEEVDMTAWKEKLDALAVQTKRWSDIMKDITAQTAQAMSTAMGDGFFNALTGQMSSAKEMFADFGRSILRILSDVIAKLIITQSLGRYSSAFNLLGMTFHQGGVVRAHSGYLASDEIPIVAQSGEGILSRRGVAALGAGNLQRLNNGQGIDGAGGNVTININPVIQAWDASDVYRNQEAITSVISRAISSNSDIRRIIKAYT